MNQKQQSKGLIRIHIAITYWRCTRKYMGDKRKKNKRVRKGPKSLNDFVLLFTVYLFFVLKDSGSIGCRHLLLTQRRSAVTFQEISFFLDPERAHTISLILKFIIHRHILLNPGFNFLPYARLNAWQLNAKISQTELQIIKSLWSIEGIRCIM